MTDRIFRVYLKDKKFDNIVIYKPMKLYEGKIKVYIFTPMNFDINGNKNGTSMNNVSLSIDIPYDMSIYPNEEGKKEIVVGFDCGGNEEKFRLNEDGFFSLRRIDDNLVKNINQSYELRYVKEKKIYEIGIWGDTPVTFTFEGDKLLVYEKQNI